MKLPVFTSRSKPKLFVCLSGFATIVCQNTNIEICASNYNKNIEICVSNQIINIEICANNDISNPIKTWHNINLVKYDLPNHT